jgi:hypothetical protein
MGFDALRPQAGRYAQQRYRAGLTRWRARVVRPLRPAFRLAGAGLVAAELMWQESLHDWLLGLATGGLIGLWIAIADSPPAHIERWSRGARGERKTERALRPLRRTGWNFAHDVDTGRGNRDHVVVGPGGVFLLETKRPDGAVSVEGDGLRVQRLDDPEQLYRIYRLALASALTPPGSAKSFPRPRAAGAGCNRWSWCGRRSQSERSSITASCTYTVRSSSDGCNPAIAH